MTEQLGVDRERHQAGASALGGKAPEALGDGRQEGARLAAGDAAGDLRVVGPAADRPRARAAKRLAVEVGVGRIGGVAVERPQP